VKTLVDQGFRVMATAGTAKSLRAFGIEVEPVNKVHEGSPHTADRIEAGDVALVINTVGPDPQAVEDSRSLRRAALMQGVPYCTTMAAARASADAIAALRAESIGVRSLQQIHEKGLAS
ncbi:MAG TPA: carbamoyl phosphate synthase large subunit, partial [Myxococcota bacterium]|nr:carbamoyl phosphate synthase large subunit [Myxococcota bacterium]